MKTVVKQIRHSSLVACLFSMVVLVTSCKKDKDPKPSEQDLFIEKLSANWTVSEVTIDEVEVTNAFENLSLSFTKEKTYTTTNSVAPIWPASGTFTVASGSAVNAFMLLRNDDVLISVLSVSATRLQLEFTITAPTSRTKQVSGRYEFTFVKK